MEVRQPRQIKCTKCEQTEIEKFFGIGFVGWIPLREIQTDKNKEGFPILCPLCAKKLCEFLENK